MTRARSCRASTEQRATTRCSSRNPPFPPHSTNPVLKPTENFSPIHFLRAKILWRFSRNRPARLPPRRSPSRGGLKSFPSWLPPCVSTSKRGTHQGAIDHDYLQDYLDEFTFRFNRRKSASRGKLFYRLAQSAVEVSPVPIGSLPHRKR